MKSGRYKKIDNDKKPSKFLALCSYLIVSKFKNSKSSLSKHQQSYGTNRHKHRKHHRRYRHAKRKKFNSFQKSFQESKNIVNNLI